MAALGGKLINRPCEAAKLLMDARALLGRKLLCRDVQDVEMLTGVEHGPAIGVQPGPRYGVVTPRSDSKSFSPPSHRSGAGFC